MRIGLLLTAGLLFVGCDEADPADTGHDAAPDLARPDLARPDRGPDRTAADLADLASAEVSAPDLPGPDSGVAAPFAPAKKGVYVIGSSYAMGIRSYLQTLIKDDGRADPATDWTEGGVSIHSLWWYSVTNPSRIQPKLKQITAGAHDVLFMNAQRPWIQTKGEVIGVGGFVKEVAAKQPSFRFLIQVYWRTEQFPYRYHLTSTRQQDLAMYRRGALQVAHQVAQATKAPVFVAPVGLALEAVKELAAGGKLKGYSKRQDLHDPDGQHLSELGKYVQALVIHCAAYQHKPHGHSAKVGSATLAPSDAKLIWDSVQAVVQQTPFSGWYAKAPTSYATYIAALGQALSNWETFDLLQQSSSGSGSFVGQGGVSWSFSAARVHSVTPGLVGNSVQLAAKSGSLSTTLSGGVDQLSLVLSAASSSASVKLELWLGGKLRGTVTRQDNRTTLHANQLTGLKAKGPVKLELRCAGAGGDCLVDNLRWSDAP